MGAERRFDVDEHSGSDAFERPLGELFRSLGEDAAVLVRQEAALAQAEIRQAAREMAAAAARIGIGGGVAAAGALTLVAALVVFLGTALGGRYALSAAIVGGVLLLAGGATVFLGMRRAKAAPLAPEETVDTVRETGAWAKTKVAEFRAALSADGRARPPAAAPVRSETRPVPGRPLDVGEGAARVEGSPPGEGRGTARRAEGSADAPLWKRVVHQFQEDRVTDQSARMAYFFFMSLPPAVMAIFAITGFFAGPGTADWIMTQAAGTMPEAAEGLLSGFVDDVVLDTAPAALSVGLLLALWGGSNVFVAMGESLNRAYGIEEDRPFVKKRAIAVGMLLGCALLFLAGSVVLLAGPAIPGALGLGEAGRMAWMVLEWPLAFLLIAATFWLIYYVLPFRDQGREKLTLAKAAALSAVIWVLATAAFRFYVSNFGNYSETYGLLGAIIVLLLWLYVTSLVILLGGEIASEMQRGRAG